MLWSSRTNLWSVIEVNHCSLAENSDLLPSVSVIDRLVTSASNLGNSVANISFHYGDLLCPHWRRREFRDDASHGWCNWQLSDLPGARTKQSQSILLISGYPNPSPSPGHHNKTLFCSMQTAQLPMIHCPARPHPA